jgi:transformer-2 protein
MSDRGSSPRPSKSRSRSRSRSHSPRVQDEDKKSPREEDKRSGDDEPRDAARSRSRSPAARTPAAKPDVANPGNNLYVANLAARVGESELQEMFSKFGRVAKCEVILDPVTKESRGFGFVTFDDIRDAEDAVKELNK